MTMIQVLDRAAQAASDDAETWRELQTDLSSLVADLAGVTLEHANRQFAPEQHALALLHVLLAWRMANPNNCTFVVLRAMFEGLYAAVMILIAHKQFERAFRLTFQTTTLPAEAPSAIAVAAWKKHILLSALLNRKAMSLSEQSSLSGIVSRNISRLCVPYEDFAKALGKSTSPADVAALVTRHTETFTRDGNLGLVKQCVAAGDRHRVHKLTKVYVKLSFEDVKVKAGLASEAQAEAILADMIAKGTIRARIDQPNRTVAFADVTVSAHEEQAAAETIQHLVQRVQGLLQLLDTKDRAVQLSKPYIEAVSQRQAQLLSQFKAFCSSERFEIDRSIEPVGPSNVAR
ncbi:uncharacterized protein MONBRDRAFT_10101 [Monosiga brevicollis MX1]|uniref:COP9 signalosome complex subunit 3 n=1 Tax=Monosiga brevicollis TaxID=81824 RepID=A9V581_MONBE|nr:uncharacterized protein MONBRDRAFT_10101 [Monosiga brevicollis MX1]EDQ87332.1 predicted protein [Monosiga brevicollis MX1]|eukprot:XP_001747945.1 hypothetical protein [Monosiga brevicollis MX1]